MDYEKSSHALVISFELNVYVVYRELSSTLPKTVKFACQS